MIKPDIFRAKKVAKYIQVLRKLSIQERIAIKLALREFKWHELINEFKPKGWDNMKWNRRWRTRAFIEFDLLIEFDGSVETSHLWGMGNYEEFVDAYKGILPGIVGE